MTIYHRQSSNRLKKIKRPRLQWSNWKQTLWFGNWTIQISHSWVRYFLKLLKQLKRQKLFSIWKVAIVKLSNPSSSSQNMRFLVNAVYNFIPNRSSIKLIKWTFMKDTHLPLQVCFCPLVFISLLECKLFHRNWM